jgi:hypothetical protein
MVIELGVLRSLRRAGGDHRCDPWGDMSMCRLSYEHAHYLGSVLAERRLVQRLQYALIPLWSARLDISIDCGGHACS